MKNLWNNFILANEENEQGKSIFIPFGKWPWNKEIDQVFNRENAKKIAEKLEEPGIPVYQGHPDVPELAAKYPDKGAIGWIKKIDVEEKGCRMQVEWDRWPGKGFAYFSPYWMGEASEKDGKITVTVSEIRSIGLVNRPNIKQFKLPNEELEQAKEEKQMKDILRMLGLPEDATTEQAMGAIGKLKGEIESLTAKVAKCDADKVALEDECKTVKASNEEVKASLANAQKELEETKTALANEQAEAKKIRELKTQSVTEGLANEQHTTDNRLALVNELMVKNSIDFDEAWGLAKSQKPDLFK